MNIRDGQGARNAAGYQRDLVRRYRLRRVAKQRDRTSGNVCEWVQDCWHESYEDAPADGSAWLVAERGDCNKRVVRGGSLLNRPRYVRSAVRGEGFANDISFNQGFRVARDLE